MRSGRRPGSILDGFFTNDVDAVALAARALLDPTVADADRSHGQVRNGDGFVRNGVAGRDGILCAKIFGPFRALCCTCGKTNGEAQRDVTCDRCGVLCADPSLRDWRFGHVVIAGAVHPLLYDAVARALGVTAADVRAVALGRAALVDGQVVHATPEPDDPPGYEPMADTDVAGFEALDDALAALDLEDLRMAAIVRALPLPPPGDRPPVADFAITMRTPWIGPLNVRIADFVVRADRQVRLIELQAPPIIQVNEAGAVQRMLEGVVDAIVHPPSPLPAPWRGTPDRVVPCAGALALPPSWGSRYGGEDDPPHTAPTGVQGLFWLDDGDLLVQRADAFVIVSAEDGRERRRWPSSLRSARRQLGRRLLCDAWMVPPYELPEGIEIAERADLAILDLDVGWLDAVPADVAAITAEHGEPEEVSIVDLASGAAMPCPWGGNDRPQLLAWTRDGRFAWMGSEDDGGVLEVDTGIPHLTRGTGEHDDDTPAVFLADIDGDLDDGRAEPALALTPDNEWRFLTANDEDGFGALVATEERTLLLLRGPIGATAFSPDGARVAVVVRLPDREELAIVDVAGARVVARFPCPEPAR